MDDFAGEGYALYWVSIGERPVVSFAHGLEKMGLPSLVAIFDLSPTHPPESEKQARIDSGCRLDPFIVGAGEAVGSIDPCPHYQGR